MDILTKELLEEFTNEDGTIDVEALNASIAKTVQDNIVTPAVVNTKKKLASKTEVKQSESTQENDVMKQLSERLASLESELTQTKQEKEQQAKRRQLEEELVEKGANKKLVDKFLNTVNVETLELDDDIISMLSKTDGHPQKIEEDPENVGKATPKTLEEEMLKGFESARKARFSK